MSSTVVECTKEVFAFFHGHNGEITDNVTYNKLNTFVVFFVLLLNQLR